MKPPWICWRLLAPILWLGSACALAEDLAAPAAWVYTRDGSLVVHRVDKLIWSRCVQGMQWTGKTCAGTPELASYSQAVAMAAARTKIDGVNWRLPTVLELQHLVNKSGHPSGMDASRFPGAPHEWHWSGTANIDTTQVNPYSYGNVMQGRNSANANEFARLKGWAVNLATAQARGDVNKRTRLMVRLVAPQD